MPVGTVCNEMDLRHNNHRIDEMKLRALTQDREEMSGKEDVEGHQSIKDIWEWGKIWIKMKNLALTTIEPLGRHVQR